MNKGAAARLEGRDAFLLRPRAEERSIGGFTTAFAGAYLLMLSGAFYSLFSTTLMSGYVVEKAGTSANYTMVWVALYATLVFKLRHELLKPVELVARNRFFALFLFSAIISYVFSPPVTQLVATKMAMYAITLLFGLFVTKSLTVERFFAVYIAISAAVLVAHWAIFPYQSPFAYDFLDRANLIGTRPYGGLFAHKNLAGMFFGLSFLACYGRAMTHERRRLLFSVLAFGHAFALVYAGAAGALFCVSIAAVVMTVVHLYARRSKFLPIFLLAVAIMVMLVAAVGTSSLLNAVGRDTGLSGRWRVFAAWPEYFWQHPLFGWGYANFFSGLWNQPAEGLRLLTPYHARYFTFESAYLEFAIDFGLVGAGFFFAMMAVGFRNATLLARRDDVACGSVPLGWLIFIAITSISDTGLRIHNLLTPAIVAWTYFGLSARGSRAEPASDETAPAAQPWRPMWMRN